MHGKHNAGLGGKHTDQRKNNKLDEAAAVARAAVMGILTAAKCGGSIKDKGRWACGLSCLARCGYHMWLRTKRPQ